MVPIPTQTGGLEVQAAAQQLKLLTLVQSLLKQLRWVLVGQVVVELVALQVLLLIVLQRVERAVVTEPLIDMGKMAAQARAATLI